MPVGGDGDDVEEITVVSKISDMMVECFGVSDDGFRDVWGIRLLLANALRNLLIETAGEVLKKFLRCFKDWNQANFQALI